MPEEIFMKTIKKYRKTTDKIIENVIDIERIDALQ